MLDVAFVVNDLALSGGVGVVVQHARQLAARHGMDVTLVLARPLTDPTWGYDDLEHLHVASLDEARARQFDIAVSTWWETAPATFALRARRYASFVQSLEDRFYSPEEPERTAAGLVLDLPVAFITEARWIRDTLSDLRPDARCLLVRNGIDKDVFVPLERVVPRFDGPLRILVEGYAGTWFKGVNASVAAVRAMREPAQLTVVAPDRTGLDVRGVDRVVGPVPQREMADLYAQTDVVLKLSRVEGMYGPPLEGFHRGATVVTTEVTGHEEYVVHGRNGLVVDWDDLGGTAHALDLLARDRRLLHELRCGALATARSWPSWEQAGELMALALRTIAREPAPDPYAHVPRLLSDARSQLEHHRVHLRELSAARRDVAKFDRIRALPGIRQYLALKRIERVQKGIAASRKLLRR
ncbi:MAG TPA: glycosyltransferase family 4 protein [Baekduia sp.]|nr:glycosyltransferase family 4 protein [Baekduia sp.]